MSLQLENWERDRNWLLQQRPDATDAEQENFCESVAKHWQCCGDDLTARNRALEDLKNGLRIL